MNILSETQTILTGFASKWTKKPQLPMSQILKVKEEVLWEMRGNSDYDDEGYYSSRFPQRKNPNS